MLQSSSNDPCLPHQQSYLFSIMMVSVPPPLGDRRHIKTHSVINKLNTIQATGLRICLCVPRTASTEALQAEAGESPPDLRREQWTAQYYIQPFALPEDHPHTTECSISNLLPELILFLIVFPSVLSMWTLFHQFRFGIRSGCTVVVSEEQPTCYIRSYS